MSNPSTINIIEEVAMSISILRKKHNMTESLLSDLLGSLRCISGMNNSIDEGEEAIRDFLVDLHTDH